VVRAQSRVAEARANVTSAQKNLGAVQASYREFFGEDYRSVTATSAVFEVNATGDWLSEVGLAGQLGWKVRMAQSAKTAAQADLKSTEGKSLASFSLEYSNTRRDWLAPGVPGTDQTVAIVARQTLYTGGADTARIAQAQQKVNQAQEELDSAQLEYKRLLDQAVLEVEALEPLVDSRRIAAELAADSLRMVREQYAYRRGTLLDLLTAQETLYFAGRDLIDAQIDKAMAVYKLLSVSALLNRFVGLAAN
jgi:outer membrane protein TolC